MDEPGDHHAEEAALPDPEPPLLPPLPPAAVPSSPTPGPATPPPPSAIRHQNRAQTEAVFRDKIVLRRLFRRFCEMREPYELAKEDHDGHISSQVDSLRTPADKNDVMMDPYVFRRVTRELRFKPTIDLFASYEHHQVPRYFSRYADPHSSGVDAFSQDWTKEVRPYANPPWPLIGRVLKKVAKDQLRILMVVPQWPKAPWTDLLTKLSEKSVTLTDAIFLDAQGRLRPKPWWNTEVHILNGTLLNS